MIANDIAKSPDAEGGKTGPEAERGSQEPNITDTAMAVQKQAMSALMPTLAALDHQGSTLELAAERGEQIDPSSIVGYELRGQHVRHLMASSGLTRGDVVAAEPQHQGAGESGYVRRALDHASNPHTFEPTPPGSASTEREPDCEGGEIDVDM